LSTQPVLKGGFTHFKDMGWASLAKFRKKAEYGMSILGGF
jgi:hypothetical protein